MERDLTTGQDRDLSAPTEGGFAGVEIPSPVDIESAELIGIAAAPGLRLGQAVVLPNQVVTAQDQKTISPNEIDDHIARLSAANERMKEEMSTYVTELYAKQEVLLAPFKTGSQSPNEEQSKILRDLEHTIFSWEVSYVLILKEAMKQADALVNSKFTAAFALQLAFLPVIERNLEELKPEMEGFLAKLIEHVNEPERHRPYENLAPGTVLVARELSTFQLREVGPHNNIAAIVTDHGGRFGHVNVTSRAQGWALVTGTENATKSIKDGDTVLVDGDTGRIWINPDSARERWFHTEQERRIDMTTLTPIPGCDVTTRDGHRAIITTNIDLVSELKNVVAVFPAGQRTVGLYRSEEDLLNNNKKLLLDEAGQLALYQEIIKTCEGNPVTIRTVDWGGEKSPTEYPVTNPDLGPRGIRHSLLTPEARDVLKIQLRALARASATGAVRIMLPMVTDAEEIDEVLHMMSQVKDELLTEGLDFNEKNISFGVMIETPAGVLALPKILPKVSFISIGSNDLTQYTLAADRSFRGDSAGKWVSHFGPHHPALLHNLHEIISACHESGVPVSVCGEMASNPFYQPLLDGLDLEYYSVTPRAASGIRRSISTQYHSECVELVGQIMFEATGGESALRLLEAFHDKHNISIHNESLSQALQE